jgi:hypothetical protein
MDGQSWMWSQTARFLALDEKGAKKVPKESDERKNQGEPPIRITLISLNNNW